MAALPMGWSQALALCQMVAERAALRAGLDDSARIIDGRPPPPVSSGAHLEYVDNFAAMASSEQRANDMLNRVVTQLRSLGLPVHEVEPAQLQATLLGWFVDGDSGLVMPTRRRAWRLVLATRELLQLRSVSGAVGQRAA